MFKSNSECHGAIGICGHIEKPDNWQTIELSAEDQTLWKTDTELYRILPILSCIMHTGAHCCIHLTSIDLVNAETLKLRSN